MTVEQLRNGDTDYRLYKTITFDGGPMSYNEAFKKGAWQGWSHHKQIDIYCIISNEKGGVLFPFADTKEFLCYIENAETLEVYTHQDLIIKENVVTIQRLALKDKTSTLQHPNSIDWQRRYEIDNKINLYCCMVALLFMTRYPYLATLPIIIMYFINFLSPINE